MFSGWWVSPTWIWGPKRGAGSSGDKAAWTVGGEGSRAGGAQLEMEQGLDAAGMTEGDGSAEEHAKQDFLKKNFIRVWLITMLC